VLRDVGHRGLVLVATSPSNPGVVVASGSRAATKSETPWRMRRSGRFMFFEARGQAGLAQAKLAVGLALLVSRGSEPRFGIVQSFGDGACFLRLDMLFGPNVTP
jgi:hypothetical protein